MLRALSGKTYRFKPKNYPNTCSKLESFEKDLFNMVKKIEFKNVRDEFQANLKKDISEIKSSSEVYVFADKTTNIYKMSVDTHEMLLKENIAAVCKKAPSKLEKLINLEAKSLTKKAETCRPNRIFTTILSVHYSQRS